MFTNAVFIGLRFLSVFNTHILKIYSPTSAKNTFSSDVYKSLYVSLEKFLSNITFYSRR